MGKPRDSILLFLDNAAAHTIHYALWNLYNEGIKVMFNCPNTPPFNIIENVFADLKFNLRKKIIPIVMIWSKKLEYS